MLAKGAWRQSTVAARSSVGAVASSSRPECAYSQRCISSSSNPKPLSTVQRRHLSSGQVRAYSLEQQPTSQSSDPLFSSTPSWDSLFQNLGDAIPARPTRPARAPQRSSPHARTLLDRSAAQQRRQSMTIREMSAFDDMFNRIFTAASEQSQMGSSWGEAKDEKTGEHPLAFLSPDASIGIGRTRTTSASTKTKRDTAWDADSLFGRIRKHSRKLQWTSEADEELDRKKEEMNLCETDLQLLEWAHREVFGESKRYEEAARVRAQERTSKEANPGQFQLQPLSYPHLIALLMRTFRDKYADPHLALSIFSYARHLSVPSFVFGCTTSAYNELIETRWRAFRDLKGVCDALEEMQVNGVGMDGRTKVLCECVRREVGERELWSEDRGMGSGEAWEMVELIDKVVAGGAVRPEDDIFKAKGRRSRTLHMGARGKGDEERDVLGGWKKRMFEDGKGKDDWEFGKWDSLVSAA